MNNKKTIYPILLSIFVFPIVFLKSEEIAKPIKKLDNVTIKTGGGDLDNDGQSDLRVSVARRNDSKIISSIINIKEKKSSILIHEKDMVKTILADLDNDSFFEYLAVLNAKEEVEVVFERDRKGGIKVAPIQIAKKIWPF